MKTSLHRQVHPNTLSLSLSLSLIMGWDTRELTYFYPDFYEKDTQLGIPPQGSSAAIAPRREETGAS
jgi:hypothetical protein